MLKHLAGRSLPLILLLPLTSAHAQQGSPVTTLTSIPATLTLPIQINHALTAGSTKPGSSITAVTTQRIPLTRQLYLKSGAQLLGTVIASTKAAPPQPATLTLRFTSLRYRNQAIPLATRAIAIANFTDVADTLGPANGSTDRGNPSPASWTTRQVGGDQVVRSGWIGEVVNTVTHRVGFADYNGVYADPPPGATGPDAIPHAVGVFSTTAQGLYGLDQGATLHSTDGDITLTAPGKLLLRRGDNLLLEILTPLPDVPPAAANRTLAAPSQRTR